MLPSPELSDGGCGSRKGGPMGEGCPITQAGRKLYLLVVRDFEPQVRVCNTAPPFQDLVQETPIRSGWG